MSDDEAPALFVADEQDDVPVDLARWTTLARGVLEAEGIRPDAEMSVLFVTESAMADLNGRFMGGSGPTDVLSFPIDGAHARRNPTDRRIPSGGDAGPALMLGDVVICPLVARRNAPDHAGTLDDEVALLLVHGILHLLGHDHAADAERQTMQDRERELVTAFHGVPARDPWTS